MMEGTGVRVGGKAGAAGNECVWGGGGIHGPAFAHRCSFPVSPRLLILSPPF